MEQITFSVITLPVQDNKVVRPSQHRFMKSRSCLTSLTSSCDNVTGLVDEGKLWMSSIKSVKSFSKTFDTKHSNGETVLTLVWMGTLVVGGGEWSYIQLTAGHKWCAPGLSVGTSPV
ncbi:hypothetical protein WISP_104925 [Willisornis vidua]|uniref:Uncharacterized protein n=1 Tax=Willisornis vidua TaxID=1566151 RepID=A0ABQ9D2A3_9PASS|nr:hypothetical protein WISP_104925 [Willisornis vidua]